MRILVGLACIVVVGACGFGFLATFEPGLRNVFAFRLGYATLGLGSMIGAVLALKPRRDP